MQELPLYRDIDDVRAAADGCQACGRSQTRQQVVFGWGDVTAPLMLIGEAPSSTDDATGKPFTGPAGKLLDTVLEEAGIQRSRIWITNLVRCFAGRERNDRVENRPARVSEINACRRWLDLELQYVNPRVILAVGAPAAKQFLGRDFRLQEQRGQLFDGPGGRRTIATIQPAYVMRLRNLVDEAAYNAARNQLAADIRLAVTEAGIVP